MAWAVRRAGPLLVATVVAGVLLGPVAADRRPRPVHQATALVVAQQLAVSPLGLPRFGSVTFSSGEVALAVRDELQPGLRPSEIVPAKVSVTPVQDTFLFQVVGHDADPALAISLANVAAAAFTEQLNLPGRGIGTFRVVQPARFATQAQGLSSGAAAGLGGGAGLLLGTGLLWLVVAVRRPVVTGEEAAAVSGAPLIGEVRARDGLPRSAGEVARLRRLLDSPRGVLLSGGPAATRHGTLRLLVRSATGAPLTLVVPPSEREAVDAAVEGLEVAVCSDVDGLLGDATALLRLPRAMVVSRAATAVDSARSVLLVRRGESRRAVRRRALQAVGQPAGLLLVVRGGRFRMRLRARSPHTRLSLPQVGEARS